MADLPGVRSLLKDVQLHGMVLIDRRKLLFLLGRQYDTASAWSELLAQWQEIGGKRGDLYGGWIDGQTILLLTTKSAMIQPVSEWTNE